MFVCTGYVEIVVVSVEVSIGGDTTSVVESEAEVCVTVCVSVSVVL